MPEEAKLGDVLDAAKALASCSHPAASRTTHDSLIECPLCGASSSNGAVWSYPRLVWVIRKMFEGTGPVDLKKVEELQQFAAGHSRYESIQDRQAVALESIAASLKVLEKGQDTSALADALRTHAKRIEEYIEHQWHAVR